MDGHDDVSLQRFWAALMTRTWKRERTRARTMIKRFLENARRKKSERERDNCGSCYVSSTRHVFLLMLLGGGNGKKEDNWHWFCADHSDDNDGNIPQQQRLGSFVYIFMTAEQQPLQQQHRYIINTAKVQHYDNPSTAFPSPARKHQTRTPRARTSREEKKHNNSDDDGHGCVFRRSTFRTDDPTSCAWTISQTANAQQRMSDTIEPALEGLRDDERSGWWPSPSRPRQQHGLYRPGPDHDQNYVCTTIHSVGHPWLSYLSH